MQDYQIERHLTHRQTAAATAISVPADPLRVAIGFTTDNGSATFVVYADATANAARIVSNRNGAQDGLLFFHQRDWGILIQGPWTVVPAGTPNMVVWEILAPTGLTQLFSKV